MTTMLGISLEGRPVVLVGGGSVTARRLRRLHADGAVVRVVAPALAPETAQLVADHGLEWRARTVRPSDLDAAWLVHTATGDDRVDREVSAWCEARRILCVNASDGAHGSARMTAEVRAGDVVVGVASDAGVDPRRTARVAAAIRGLLDEGAAPLRRVRETAAGQVALVGGGPGPVDLLTLRGRRLLAEADVVVADRLGATAVLDELDPDVEIVHVGKAPGHHPVPQDGINAILVRHARAGRRVVRLKGGDPFVYGRGGEEVTACLAAGVPVEVVPGVTSAVAVPQSAGIPVTHRGVAGSVHLVNGPAGATATTLAALADPSVTTVILMGVAAFGEFAEAALAARIREDLPVAFVESGHTPAQRTTRATLATARRAAAEAGVQNPAVIVVGAVAREGLLLPAPAVGAATGREAE
ncbi:uroporphyrinogen-III C-methyltransferase [Microbacterium sp. ZXX196]|uniref:uroporphyrinogen-III C-methyltransferase n=1 Tax=Microbacterium sp. ZXX196 TaxID=2609291 RepID=UPI0012B94014|nr:uroporphyrinogen-III C-methyltransferase [Microbacterium sp. ZXX196]MTE23670.1 uroporphyrinogen-III C-methyltransferase [Microbacterium sp. ZXX196]